MAKKGFKTIVQSSPTPGDIFFYRDPPWDPTPSEDHLYLCISNSKLFRTFDRFIGLRISNTNKGGSLGVSVESTLKDGAATGYINPTAIHSLAWDRKMIELRARMIPEAYNLVVQRVLSTMQISL